MIITHEHFAYKRKWQKVGSGRYNGAFYYSKEICKNMIPNVQTDRNWITVNVKGVGCDHAIVFCHNNKNPSNYDWLSKYDDLILVCGVPETCDKVAHLGKAIYLPLSVDVAYIEQYKTAKDKDTAFVGRRVKANWGEIPQGVDYLCSMPREQILKQMARYQKVYAVGRCALEAKVLGCEVLPYDPRFPDPDIWQVIDNKEAAVMLQRMINEIDGVKK